MPILANPYNADEKTYQMAFYKDIFENKNSINKLYLDKNTDGYTDGILFEHKTNVTAYGLGKTLSQALLYLVRFNVDGHPIPGKIMLVSQDEQTVYLYNTEDYLDIINNVAKYAGVRASKGIDGFIPTTKPRMIKYKLGNARGMQELLAEIDAPATYAKVNITLDNVYGWSGYYYKNAHKCCQKPEKKEFFKELRDPKATLYHYINKWSGDETEFGLLMDLLNDPMSQKKLGAFYTPEPYCELGAELVRKAIARVPEGNDYVIIDRCGGVGNLENVLTDDELSHVIVSTYELKEWYVLHTRFNKRVRAIIPVTISREDDSYLDADGFLKDADALTDDYLNRLETIIEQTKKTEKVTRIIFENPPYAETTSVEHQKKGLGKQNSTWKTKPLVDQMRHYVKDHPEISDKATNDIGNVFIWSAFEKILKESTDSLIVYSPVKYWKAQHLIQKKFIDGYAVNRKHFHTKTNACIMIALWSNEDVVEEELILKAVDLEHDTLIYEGEVKVKPIHSLFSEAYYDKRKFEDDTYNGIAIELNGLESTKTDKQISVSKTYNKNILGYMLTKTSGFDNPRLSSNLLIAGKYDAHGFYLREDNFLEKLPIFVASRYTDHINNWKTMSLVMKSGDGKERFEADVKAGKLDDFLCKCLIWTSLTHYAHMRSLYGSDGRLYQNQLCFDGEDTIASKTLKYFIDNGYQITQEEADLLYDWKTIIERVRTRRLDGTYKYPYNKDENKGYNPEFKYGLYQIDEEVNYKEQTGLIDRLGKPIISYHDGDLNNWIKSFKKKVKAYYINNLVDTLFEYEFLK